MLDLIRKKQAELQASDSEMHPDAYKKPAPEFEGNVNPKTGEVNGPKNEPLKHGDWSLVVELPTSKREKCWGGVAERERHKHFRMITGTLEIS